MSTARRSPTIKRQLALEALPGGSIITDEFGAAWRKGGVDRFGDEPVWYRAYDSDESVGERELSFRMKTCKVLREGQA